jgi:hypothetical protein
MNRVVGQRTANVQRDGKGHSIPALSPTPAGRSVDIAIGDRLHLRNALDPASLAEQMGKSLLQA